MPRLIDADALTEKAQRMYGESEAFSIAPVAMRAVLLNDIYRAPPSTQNPCGMGGGKLLNIDGGAKWKSD